MKPPETYTPRIPRRPILNSFTCRQCGQNRSSKAHRACIKARDAGRGKA